MKKFLEPEVIVIRFDAEDILDASTNGSDGVIKDGDSPWSF